MELINSLNISISSKNRIARASESVLKYLSIGFRNIIFITILTAIAFPINPSRILRRVSGQLNRRSIQSLPVFVVHTKFNASRSPGETLDAPS
ncbi:MAG: hypothetical protein QXU34_08200 [Ignisphaera sp.]